MKRLSVFLGSLFVLASLSGCIGTEDITTDDGTEVEIGESLDDWPTYFVPSSTDLPTCDSTMLGRLYYVEDVANFQACTSSGWEVIDVQEQVNQPPRVTASLYTDDDWHWELFSSSDAWMYRGLLTWSAVDPEGSAVSVGVDHDRDGMVDIALPYQEGTLLNEADPSDPFLVLPWNGSIIGERWQSEEGCGIVFTRYIDVIATDADGQSTTITMATGAFSSRAPLALNNIMEGSAEDVEVFFGPYVSQDDLDWMSGEATDSPCTSDGGGGGDGGDLFLWAFEADQPSIAPSAGTQDKLATVAMTQGGNLDFNDVSVQIMVDGSPKGCQRSIEGEGADVDGPSCYYVYSGGSESTSWSAGYEIALYENGVDLCSGSCTISVNLEIDDTILTYSVSG
jgi:hypothetical protein